MIKNVLTKEQKDFIKKYKIPEELLFDALGEGFSEDLQQRMVDESKAFAYNAEACIMDADHNFRTIGGACAQCEPSKIASALREYKTGYIYLSGSVKGGLIKIGSSNETKDRIITFSIPSSKFAGYDDWELLFHAKTAMLGRVERLVQERLAEYKADYHPEKSGKLLNGGELYRCSYLKAKEAVMALNEEGAYELSQTNEKRHLISEYQFKNLRARPSLVAMEV
jgi:hypothetical protein